MDLKNNRGVHIAHCNVRSLAANFNVIKQQIHDSGIHIFTLSETWLNSNHASNYLRIHGYKLLRLDRQAINVNTGKTKSCGGLAIYIKSDLCYSTSENAHLNVSNNDMECMWITVSQPNQRKIIVAATYRPPKGNSTQYGDYLNDSVHSVSSNSNADIFILGDMNINYMNKGCYHRKNLQNFERLTGLRQIINEVTRMNPKMDNIGLTVGGSLIDLIYTNCDIIAESGTLNWAIADHEVIYVTRKKSKEPARKIKFKRRTYRNYSQEQFQRTIRAYCWDDFLELKNPEEWWKVLLHRITEIADTMCPIKNYIVKEKRDPWITNEILKKLKDKDFARKTAKQTKLKKDWINQREQINEVKSLIKRAKKEYIIGNLERHVNDTKKFWGTIGEIIPSNKKDQVKIHLVDRDSAKPIPESDIANSINKYFTNIGPDLAKQLNATWSYDGEITDLSIPDVTTDEETVTKLCKEIDIGKSSAIENISSTLIRDALLAIPTAITYVMNICLKNGVFPLSWKTGTVIPLQKDGDVTDISNLRPVSLLPIPGKILEKILGEEITKFLEENHLFNDKQDGFRKNNSTINTVARFTDDIYRAINSKEFTLTVFIDLRKAFDTVNHSILKKKLYNMGIRGKTLTSLEDYLIDRSQRTVANGIMSDRDEVVCGVAQVSILTYMSTYTECP